MLAHEARYEGEPCDHACLYYDRMKAERNRAMPYRHTLSSLWDRTPAGFDRPASIVIAKDHRNAV